MFHSHLLELFDKSRGFGAGSIEKCGEMDYRYIQEAEELHNFRGDDHPAGHTRFSGDEQLLGWPAERFIIENSL